MGSITSACICYGPAFSQHWNAGKGSWVLETSAQKQQLYHHLFLQTSWEHWVWLESCHPNHRHCRLLTCLRSHYALTMDQEARVVGFFQLLLLLTLPLPWDLTDHSKNKHFGNVTLAWTILSSHNKSCLIIKASSSRDGAIDSYLWRMLHSSSILGARENLSYTSRVKKTPPVSGESVLHREWCSSERESN